MLSMTGKCGLEAGASELVDVSVGGPDDTTPVVECGTVILDAANDRRIENCNTSDVTFLETFLIYHGLSSTK